MVRRFPVRPQFMVGRLCNNCVYNQTSLGLTIHLPTKRIVVQVELSSLEEILLERAVSDHERKCWSGEGGGREGEDECGADCNCHRPGSV